MKLVCYSMMMSMNMEAVQLKERRKNISRYNRFSSYNFVAEQLICLREFYFLFLLLLENLINKCKLLDLKE